MKLEEPTYTSKCNDKEVHELLTYNSKNRKKNIDLNHVLREIAQRLSLN